MRRHGVDGVVQVVPPSVEYKSPLRRPPTPVNEQPALFRQSEPFEVSPVPAISVL